MATLTPTRGSTTVDAVALIDALGDADSPAAVRFDALGEGVPVGDAQSLPVADG
jgi:hypothetical protein